MHYLFFVLLAALSACGQPSVEPDNLSVFGADTTPFDENTIGLKDGHKLSTMAPFAFGAEWDEGSRNYRTFYLEKAHKTAAKNAKRFGTLAEAVDARGEPITKDNMRVFVFVAWEAGPIATVSKFANAQRPLKSDWSIDSDVEPDEIAFTEIDRDVEIGRMRKIEQNVLEIGERPRTDRFIDLCDGAYTYVCDLHTRVGKTLDETLLQLVPSDQKAPILTSLTLDQSRQKFMLQFDRDVTAIRLVLKAEGTAFGDGSYEERVSCQGNSTFACAVPSMVSQYVGSKYLKIRAIEIFGSVGHYWRFIEFKEQKIGTDPEHMHQAVYLIDK